MRQFERRQGKRADTSSFLHPEAVSKYSNYLECAKAKLQEVGTDGWRRQAEKRVAGEELRLSKISHKIFLRDSLQLSTTWGPTSIPSAAVVMGEGGGGQGDRM